jgi:serine/threonine-protein kinase
VALFKRNAKRHPVESFEMGVFECSNCHTDNPLEGYVPLGVDACQKCNTPHFIPQYIGGFWLFHPLGGGGMGAVYKAYHADDPDNEYAVKVLPRDQKDNPMLIANLEAESGIINALGEHPCIVSAVDCGQADGEMFLAMRFVEGDRLDRMIAEQGSMDEKEVALIGLRILAGEAHIYNQGYLFRDLKPENVIITEEDGAFLFDYGICMRVEEALLDPGDIIQGSPLYFPPERLTGDGERACSEIYSLGMVLYHCLAGQPYFSAKEINTIARQHMRSTRLADTKMKNISPYFAAIIEKMIRREPQERYQTFIEAERALYQMLMTMG